MSRYFSLRSNPRSSFSLSWLHVGFEGFARASRFILEDDLVLVLPSPFLTQCREGICLHVSLILSVPVSLRSFLPQQHGDRPHKETY